MRGRVAGITQQERLKVPFGGIKIATCHESGSLLEHRQRLRWRQRHRRLLVADGRRSALTGRGNCRSRVR